MLLEVALDPGLLDNDLLDPSSPAARLIDLVGIRGLRLFALPSNDPDILSVLAHKKVPVAEFHEKSGLPLLRTPNSTELIYETDLLITRPHNQLRAAPNAVWILEPESALELIRILLVGKGIFEVFPGYRVDETLHYIYRFKKLFPVFQTAWSVAVATKDCGLPSGVFEQLGSLSRRGEFLCRAADSVTRISILTLVRRQNTPALPEYHVFPR